MTSQITTALARVREANSLHHVPQTMLTAAFYAGAVEQDFDAVQRFLAEAEQIAEQGAMPLCLADIHLTRARLAGSWKGDVRSLNYPGITRRMCLVSALD